MGIAFSKFTVLFENPFWIGVYERQTNGTYEVCRIVFGAEPKDYDVYEFLLKNWNDLKFSPSIKVEVTADKKVNPKRLQREVKSSLKNAAIGTKAQTALKLMHEKGKEKRRKATREIRDAENKRQFLLHKIKQKQKHSGH